MKQDSPDRSWRSLFPGKQTRKGTKVLGDRPRRRSPFLPRLGRPTEVTIEEAAFDRAPLAARTAGCKPVTSSRSSRRQPSPSPCSPGQSASRPEWLLGERPTGALWPWCHRTSGSRCAGEACLPLVGATCFTVRAPGGKSRWSGKSGCRCPFEPVPVVEVSPDHITEHMRHGSRLLR
jgi:hypothetical protein